MRPANAIGLLPSKPKPGERNEYPVGSIQYRPNSGALHNRLDFEGIRVDTVIVSGSPAG